jgi:hypothetical protein
VGQQAIVPWFWVFRGRILEFVCMCYVRSVVGDVQWERREDVWFVVCSAMRGIRGCKCSSAAAAGSTDDVRGLGLGRHEQH